MNAKNANQKNPPQRHGATEKIKEQESKSKAFTTEDAEDAEKAKSQLLNKANLPTHQLTKSSN